MLTQTYYYAHRDLALLLEFDERLHEQSGFVWYASVAPVSYNLEPERLQRLRALWVAAASPSSEENADMTRRRHENAFWMRMRFG